LTDDVKDRTTVDSVLVMYFISFLSLATKNKIILSIEDRPLLQICCICFTFSKDPTELLL